MAEGKTVDEWRDYIISENHMGRMVYDGRWKYIAGRSEKHRDEECPHCEKIYNRTMNPWGTGDADGPAG